MRGLCLVFTALFATLASPLHAASLAPATVAAAQQAAAEFQALGADALKTGHPPRQTDPRVKALLDTVFDTSAVQAGVLPFAELAGVAQWTKAIQDVGKVYLFAGTGTSDPATAMNSPTLVQQVDKDTAAFAPEIGRYYDAQLGMAQAMLAGVDSHLTANPKDRARDGIATVFIGATQTFAGAVTMLATAGLTDEWRRQRLPALQAVAPHVAKVVNAGDARTLHDVTMEIARRSSDPALKEGIGKVAAHFARQRS
jgi:hypothetical protein